MEEDKKQRRYSYFGRSSQQEKLEVQTLSFVQSFLRAVDKKMTMQDVCLYQGRWLDKVRKCSAETKPALEEPPHLIFIPKLSAYISSAN